jgi:Tfp pilus assembly protein PilF
MIRVLIALAAVTALSACSWEPVRVIRESFSHAFHRYGDRHYDGEPALTAGIRKYDNGEYAAADKDLQTALKLGLGNSDRVRAHKYLAFIHCASNRLKSCRHEFRLALDIDPQMRLTPAEAGHPIWGPIFRSVKAEH